jgi:hypothetical protein
VLFPKYSQNNKGKEDETDTTCSTHGNKTNACSILMGTPQGRTPLGRPRCVWEDNIKMDLRDIGYGVVNWFRIETNGWLL